MAVTMGTFPSLLTSSSLALRTSSIYYMDGPSLYKCGTDRIASLGSYEPYEPDEPAFDDDEPFEPQDPDDVENPDGSHHLGVNGDNGTEDPDSRLATNGANGERTIIAVDDPSAQNGGGTGGGGSGGSAGTRKNAVVGLREKKIEDSKRSTTPYMTKYERARVLGTRALQIRYVFTK